MEIRQHIPNFVDGFKPKTMKFDDAEELKDIEFVKRWSENKDFFKYSLSDNYLMAEINEGTGWYVIGRIEGDLGNLDLPEFVPNHGTPEKQRNQNIKHKDIKYQDWMG